MTLEEIVNNLKSEDYGQLFNNNPRMDATKQFGGRAINNINSAGEGYSQWQRLQDQNFGPNQSVIASGFMHPQKGLSKLADWFTNNVNTAAGLPDPNQQDEASIYAYGPNIDQQAESGLNLAGLLQTGAFASGAAPKSAGGTLGTSISNSAMNKIIKELEASNKSTVPKIPTGNVFNNSLGEIPLDTRLKADNYFSGTNQPQQINISDIVPTQKNITLNNLKGVNNIDDPVNAVMMNGKYYLTDGHHRASLANLNNEKSISANVFDGEKINPNLNFELLNKHLSGQKLTPEEMALYEKNGSAMETPQLQRYNLGNANAQGGSPKARARSDGFETAPKKELYHSAKTDWESNIVDPSKSDLGFHLGSLDQASYRAKVFDGGLGLDAPIGGNIIPITKSKYAITLPLKDEGAFRPDVVGLQLEKKKMLDKGYVNKMEADPLNSSDYWKWNDVYAEKMRDVLKQNDYHGAHYENAQEGPGKSFVITDPSIIRSRFAAFDPLRKNSSSLLASGLLGSLLLKQMNQESSQQ